MSTLTRILLNPRTRQGRKLLANPQAMHAAVRSSFPPDLDESQSRVLWRVDQRGEEYVLYIVGPEKPTCTHIVEQAGWDTRPAQTADYSRLLKSLQRGQRWHFEIVANPTYSEFISGKRGRVKAHVSVQHQLNWLYSKAESAGFALAPRAEDQVSDEQRQRWGIGDEVQITQRWTDSFYKGQNRSGQPVRIAKARYSGTLEVTDVAKMQSTLEQGLGRARGYGCGLLTLARLD